jgi:hypothetical protein
MTWTDHCGGAPMFLNLDVYRWRLLAVCAYVRLSIGRPNPVI